MQKDIIQRFHAALPEVRGWIDSLLEEHGPDARPVSGLGLERLAVHFPDAVLERARVVEVPGVPFPPLARMGLRELAGFENLPYNGITFGDTIFLRRGAMSESLIFHELVHVVQWSRLGVGRFLLAYGAGLVRFGYEDSPLERMAYSLQERFEADDVPEDLVQVIETETDAIWAQVAPQVKRD